jgi:uncharacterized DUF497 family protein
MIKLEFEDFDWDEVNKSKILKRFEMHIVEEFFKQDLFIILDKQHSQNEERFIAIGEGPRNKPMFVCFTIRIGKIRVISARFMRAKEAMKYEEFKKSI